MHYLTGKRRQWLDVCWRWKHGVPTRLIHDRAAEFLVEVLQETATLLWVTQLPTSGSHPQTDSLVERFNRTLKKMLAKLVKSSTEAHTEQTSRAEKIL